jgi:hypothetical protein
MLDSRGSKGWWRSSPDRQAGRNQIRGANCFPRIALGGDSRLLTSPGSRERVERLTPATDAQSRDSNAVPASFCAATRRQRASSRRRSASSRSTRSSFARPVAASLTYWEGRAVVRCCLAPGRELGLGHADLDDLGLGQWDSSSCGLHADYQSVRTAKRRMDRGFAGLCVRSAYRLRADQWRFGPASWPSAREAFDAPIRCYHGTHI